MPRYPPKLLDVEEAEFGSVLTLSEGRRVPIDIGPTRLAEAFTAYGSPTMAETLAERSLAVFADVLQTSDEEWAAISRLVQKTRTAEMVLRPHRLVWSGFHDSYDVIMAKPHRVYGGLGHALYTSHPFHFHDDPNRPVGWRRALLNAPGGWLFEARVHLQSCQVEIAAHVLHGHFLE
jgi:hypothetical protein